MLPNLDAAGPGVHWVSVARIIKTISDAGEISKRLRASLKTRLATGDDMVVLNTLTVRNRRKSWPLATVQY